MIIVTPCVENHDEYAGSSGQFVMIIVTSLYYHIHRPKEDSHDA